MSWKLQDAKQKFSEVVDRALREGPQVVTRRGEEVVVVLSIAEYRRLLGRRPDFRRFLLEGPSWPDLDIERSREPAREMDL